MGTPKKIKEAADERRQSVSEVLAAAEEEKLRDDIHLDPDVDGEDFLTLVSTQRRMMKRTIRDMRQFEKDYDKVAKAHKKSAEQISKALFKEAKKAEKKLGKRMKKVDAAGRLADQLEDKRTQRALAKSFRSTTVADQNAIRRGIEKSKDNWFGSALDTAGEGLKMAAPLVLAAVAGYFGYEYLSADDAAEAGETISEMMT